MKSKFQWLAVRLLFTALFVSSVPEQLSNPRSPLFNPQDAPPPVPFWALLLLLVWGSSQITRLHISAIKKERLSGKSKDWSMPSWFTNPFAGPAHFFHMGANMFILMGLFGLLYSVLTDYLVLMNLLPLFFGWSILLGNTVFYAFMYEKLKATD